MADTFRDIWGRVLLRVPSSGPLLAQDWSRNAFRKVAERRTWSWLTAQGQFLFPALVSAGQASFTRLSPFVVGDATAAAAWVAVGIGLVGRQIRISSMAPIYTIAAFDGVNTLTLDQPWGAATNAATGYLIYQAYQSAPADFLSFQTVIDPQRNWQLWANRWTQTDLNTWDAQRASAGSTYAVVFRDFDPLAATAPSSAIVIQYNGTGNSPTVMFTGAAEVTVQFQITTGQAAGVTGIFRWKRITDTAWTAGVVCSVANLLGTTGITLSFDLTQTVPGTYDTTYTLNDAWSIKATVAATVPNARYEFWPHVQAEYVLPYLYVKRHPDLSASGATLPYLIRGDVLVEGALADAARWPGPSREQKSSYYSLGLADRHQLNFERMVGELERQDDELFEQDLKYQMFTAGLPWAPFPGDARFWQSHLLPSMGAT